MIYKDELGLVIDSSGDAGDSCNFTLSYYVTLKSENTEEAQKSAKLFWNNGQPVRHPTQAPWNNPKNFTRDQAVPLIPFLSVQQARQMLLATVCRLGFMPNTERDYPGTTKYPWPHEVTDLGTGVKYTRSFDFPDFAGPAFLGILVLQARFWPLYPLLPLAYLETLLKIFSHRSRILKDSLYNDSKQLYIISRYYALHNFFDAVHPYGVGPSMAKYWSGWRIQPEIGDLWKRFVTENQREAGNVNRDLIVLNQALHPESKKKPLLVQISTYLRFKLAQRF